MSAFQERADIQAVPIAPVTAKREHSSREVISIQPIGALASAAALAAEAVVGKAPALLPEAPIGSNVRHFVSGSNKRGGGGMKPLQMRRRGLL